MTIKLPNLEIYYDFVPKLASTSIRHWLYELAFKERFHEYRRDNQLFHIHNYLGDPTFDQSRKLITLNKKTRDELLTVSSKKVFYFCIVRDPIKRLLSAYSNRVTYHKELSTQRREKQEYQERNLKPHPELNYFVENLEAYQEFNPSILRHTRPMIDILNQQMSYTHVYDISQLDDLLKDVKDFLSLNYSSQEFDSSLFTELPRKQTGGTKFSLDYLSPKNVKKLGKYYACDYEYIAKARENYSSLPELSYDYIREEYLSYL